MNNLEKMTEGTIILEAKVIAREFELTNVAEAKELLFIYTVNNAKDINDVYTNLVNTIQSFTGMVRLRKSRGQYGEEEQKLERHIANWTKDKNQIEKALAMVNTPKGVH